MVSYVRWWRRRQGRDERRVAGGSSTAPYFVVTRGREGGGTCGHKQYSNRERISSQAHCPHCLTPISWALACASWDTLYELEWRHYRGLLAVNNYSLLTFLYWYDAVVLKNSKPNVEMLNSLNCLKINITNSLKIYNYFVRGNSYYDIIIILLNYLIA